MKILTAANRHQAKSEINRDGRIVRPNLFKIFLTFSEIYTENPNSLRNFMRKAFNKVHFCATILRCAYTFGITLSQISSLTFGADVARGDLASLL